MRRAVWLCLAFVVAEVAVPAAVAACSFRSPFEPLELSSEPPPDESPDLPAVSLTLENVTRGTGPERSGCTSFSSTSCDDMGVIEVHIEGLDSSLGYLFETEGTLPEGLDLPREPVRLVDHPGGVVRLRWADDATDTQESFDFSLVVTPMDEFGRLGETSEPLVVADHPGGCSAAAGGQGALLAATLALLWAAAWRRRPRG